MDAGAGAAMAVEAVSGASVAEAVAAAMVAAVRAMAAVAAAMVAAVRAMAAVAAAMVAARVAVVVVAVAVAAAAAAVVVVATAATVMAEMAMAGMALMAEQAQNNQKAQAHSPSRIPNLSWSVRVLRVSEREQRATRRHEAPTTPRGAGCEKDTKKYGPKEGGWAWTQVFLLLRSLFHLDQPCICLVWELNAAKGRAASSNKGVPPSSPAAVPHFKNTPWLAKT